MFFAHRPKQGATMTRQEVQILKNRIAWLRTESIRLIHEARDAEGKLAAIVNRIREAKWLTQGLKGNGDTRFRNRRAVA